MPMVKCPVCDVSVKTENLERHLRNQHPHEKVDLAEVLSEEDREAVEEEKAAARPGLTRGGKRMLLIVGIVVAALIALAILYPLLIPLNTQFTLPSTDGGTVSTSAWRGHVILVEFMDLDCPYCQEEAPLLVSLHQNTTYNFAGRGVEFVSIDENFEGATDTADRINQWRQATSYSCPQTGTPCFYGSGWPYCLDPGSTSIHFGTVGTNYGASSTPTIFILKKDGTVYQKYVGTAEASAANLIAGLNAALGG